MTCGILTVPCEANLTDLIVVNEIPLGVKNCFNNSFRTRYPYIDGTLEIYIDGIKISDEGFLNHIDLQGFTFLIDPSDSKKLNRPIMNIENLTVNYLRSKQVSCISNL